MIRTITFAAAKGGVGKTTLAASIGVAAMQAGERVCLVDLDPQGSLRAWGERRESEEPPVDTIAPDRLAAAITGLTGAGYTLVVIDTAGVDTVATIEAIRIADLTVVPCRASVLDFVGVRPTLAALMRLNRPYALALNSCPPGRSSRLEDAGRALALLGAFGGAITQRVDHVDALGLGLGVTEHDPDSRAATEIRSLWGWIKRRVESDHGEAKAANS